VTTELNPLLVNIFPGRILKTYYFLDLMHSDPAKCPMTCNLHQCTFSPPFQYLYLH